MTTQENKGQPLRIFRCDETEQYAALVLSRNDLVFCYACLKQLQQLLQNKDYDHLLAEALWNAAMIRFFSCFDGPKALKLELLDALPEGARDCYTFFKNYRDKHIAHRVSFFEQVKVGILLSDGNIANRGVIGVGWLGMTDASFADNQFISSLKGLSQCLISKIDVDLKTLESQILDIAKAKPIDELYKIPPTRVVVPHSTYLKKNKT